MICVVCDNPTTLLCASCKKVYFCSRSCQRTLWPIHSVYCIKLWKLGEMHQNIMPPKYGDIDIAHKNTLAIYKPIYNSEYAFANKLAAHLFIPKTESPNCEIKLSTIPNAGYGLFATRNIAAGEIADQYPASFVKVSLMNVHTRKDRSELSNTLIYPNPNDSDAVKLFIVTPREKLNEILHDYSFEFNPSMTPPEYAHLGKYTMVMISSLNKSNMYGGAHMANDGGPLKSNCLLNPSNERNGVNLIAVVPIAAGEELLCSYGKMYWHNKNIIPNSGCL